MSFIETELRDGIATLTLSRGKVNALNADVVAELMSHLAKLRADTQVRAVVLTGKGRFFSFGFDVPEFLAFSKADMATYLEAFTGLYAELFVYSKPVVAALTGHAVAGGCVLAIACDSRIMASGKAKIALNEISFGSSVLAGIAEMLRFQVGSAVATRVLYSGAMFPAEEARAMGLVDEVEPEERVMDRARSVASDLGSRSPSAFAHVKVLLRGPVAEEIRRREKDSIAEFIEIWYSPETWAKLQEIQIR